MQTYMPTLPASTKTLIARRQPARVAIVALGSPARTESSVSTAALQATLVITVQLHPVSVRHQWMFANSTDTKCSAINDGLSLANLETGPIGSVQYHIPASALQEYTEAQGISPIV